MGWVGTHGLPLGLYLSSAVVIRATEQQAATGPKPRGADRGKKPRGLEGSPGLSSWWGSLGQCPARQVMRPQHHTRMPLARTARALGAVHIPTGARLGLHPCPHLKGSLCEGRCSQWSGLSSLGVKWRWCRGDSQHPGGAFQVVAELQTCFKACCPATWPTRAQAP